MMKEYDLRMLLEQEGVLKEKIREFTSNNIIRTKKADEAEIKGHIEKAEHNLNFIKDNLKLGYLDWCTTGCYYACYHAVLALILTRGFTSKNHLATLCVLIKEFYKDGIEREDLELIDSLYIDYQDIIFYVESKNKREDATYSSQITFDKKEAENLRLKAIIFVNKIKKIMENKRHTQ